MSKIIGVTVGTTMSPQKIAGIEVINYPIRKYETLFQFFINGYKNIIFSTGDFGFSGSSTGIDLPTGSYSAFLDEKTNSVGCLNLSNGTYYSVVEMSHPDPLAPPMYGVVCPVVAIQNSLGDIDKALDELHTYAQGLATGGATE